MKSSVLLVGLAACFVPAAGPAYTPADPAAIRAQQVESTARTLGYPTRKSPAELDAMIRAETRSFAVARAASAATLEAASYTVDAVRGTCYKVVIRLGEGASWGPGAEAGVRFDFQGPGGAGVGGPGVRGPGAVASLGCAQASGPITLRMAPMIAGSGSIGQGPITMELWSHVLTRQEQADYEADQRRQEEEARKFHDEEAAKKQQQLGQGCAKCEARYQGCLGAGRGESACHGDYTSCAFEEAGPDWPSACPNP